MAHPPSLALPAGPLPCAIALAAGIAAAPRLDPILPEPARWAIALALAAVAALRWRHLALAAVFAVGVARGARPPAAPPPGATDDDRIADRVEGVIAGPVVRTARGFGARLDSGAAAAVWLWADEPLAPGFGPFGRHGFFVWPPNQRSPCASAPSVSFATSTAPASRSRSTTVAS